jgi:hypothetical protein
MRNYVALNLVRVAYNNTGPGDPPTQTVEVFGTSLANVQTNINKMNVLLGFPFFVEFEDKGIYYITLDKGNVASALNIKAGGRFIDDPSQFGLVAAPRDPPSDESHTFQSQPSSPRHGWTDASGVVKTPSPSDGKVKQKGIVGTDIKSLLALAYLVLLSEKRYVLANQFLNVLVRLNKGQITPDEAGQLYDQLIKKVGKL